MACQFRTLFESLNAWFMFDLFCMFFFCIYLLFSSSSLSTLNDRMALCAEYFHFKCWYWWYLNCYYLLVVFLCRSVCLACEWFSFFFSSIHSFIDGKNTFSMAINWWHGVHSDGINGNVVWYHQYTSSYTEHLSAKGTRPKSESINRFVFGYAIYTNCRWHERRRIYLFTFFFCLLPPNVSSLPLKCKIYIHNPMDRCSAGVGYFCIFKVYLFCQCVCVCWPGHRYESQPKATYSEMNSHPFSKMQSLVSAAAMCCGK